MSQSKPIDPGTNVEAKLSRLDWILLPLLGILTVAAISVAWNGIAEKRFRESTSTDLNCLILNDPSTGVRAIPHTACWQKIRESELIEYKFNGCGHRAGMECAPKPKGTYRIVMIGSSFNFGMWVPREKSFAALLPEELSQRTGRRVELYNEAMQWGFPASAALRMHQVLDANPDMILWVLTPTDVASSADILPYIPSAIPSENGANPDSIVDRVKLAFATNSPADAVGHLWDRVVVSPWTRGIGTFRGSASGIMLQHVIYASRSLYLKSYLSGPDAESGFLNIKPSPVWESNLQQFDRDAAAIESTAKAAGVPLVATLVPERGQSALISSGTWPAGYDPFKLDAELRNVIQNHGGIYIDVLTDFQTQAAPERGYFPVDGHPDATGHAMISGMLAKALTGGAVPGLTAAGSQVTARELSQ